MLIYSISSCEDLIEIPYWVEWIELRVDLDSHLIDFLPKLQEYKVLVTDRSVSEAGKSERNIREKIAYYLSRERYDNVYYDLELDLIESDGEIEEIRDRLFISHHSFTNLDLLELGEKIVLAKSYEPCYVKIAQHCSSFKDLLQLTRLMQKYQKLNIIWLAMGEYGYIQRLLHSYLYSQATYVAKAGKETVQGQLNNESVEKFPHLLKKKLSQWGGLIGGTQVYKSLGLKFYNNYFAKHNISATYLPIYLKEGDVDDFFFLVEENHNLSELAYGFSITMPFKRRIAEKFGHKEISNLMIYGNEPKFFNTDYDALVRIKAKLNLVGKYKVLIYGSGNMAELALQVFSEQELYLVGRNTTRLNELASQRNNREIIDRFSAEIYFDLLINTSPIGMLGEDFSQVTGFSKFKYVIDLPYSQEEIPLSKQVLKENYISGQEFWFYQSERQLHLFKERIEYDKE